MRRRDFAGGALGLVMTASAEAAGGARAALPGGGSVLVPRGFAQERPPQPGERAITLYRNLRTNAGGVPVCDGFIVVAGPGQFEDWRAFAQAGRSAGTSGWQFVPPSDPRSVWHGAEPERWRAVSVEIVGFWRVYNEPAVQAVFQMAKGLRVQVWTFERHGGLVAARRLAAALSESYRA